MSEGFDTIQYMHLNDPYVDEVPQNRTRVIASAAGSRADAWSGVPRDDRSLIPVSESAKRLGVDLQESVGIIGGFCATSLQAANPSPLLAPRL